MVLRVLGAMSLGCYRFEHPQQRPNAMPNIQVMKTLRTSCGSVAQGFITGDLTWDSDPVNETVQVIFSRIDLDKLEILELVQVDGDAWREAEDSGKVRKLIARMKKGEFLEVVLQDFLDA